MIGLAAVAGLGLSRAMAKPPVSGMDKAWLVEAHQINLAEIAVGKMAEQKGQSQAVKNAGRTLVADHQNLDRMLEAGAQKLGVQLPDSPSAAEQEQANSLEQKSGADFDEAFLHMEIQGHQEAIADTRRESKAGSSIAVTNLALKTLPVLESHLRMLEQIGEQQ
ncbi:MAG TPA: DUF4142 domain-containing protein [Gammaproteobacteria bacterium]|nr:DUF4142 domain-containing protein [Gammaproteobacteria bacterium]